LDNLQKSSPTNMRTRPLPDIPCECLKIISIKTCHVM
jgi:hypothetical protein